MKDYLKRTAELVALAFVSGVVASVQASGLDLSRAGLTGLVTAGVTAVYAALAKSKGAEDRPTVK